MYKNHLNDQQMKAVRTTEGPLMIIAGPGSGKTYTLVERIYYLIKHKEVNPESILVATFTEKAANELITRISNRLNEEGININLHEMYIGTLHSICLRILEENREFTRLKRNYSVIDQFGQQYFLYQRLGEYQSIPNSELILGDFSKTSRWLMSENLLKWINKVSEELLDVKELINSDRLEIQCLGMCYQKYLEDIKVANSLDFSNIQVEASKLLNSYPEVAAEIQRKIHYIMIDEYQDTNTVQEDIIFRIAGEKQNICVVGDDDQGLYRFRGATIRNILEFPDKFKANQCVKVELTTNYRSHPSIIDFYNEWMEDKSWEDEGTTYRYNKKIQAREESFPDIPSVVKVSSEDGSDDWEERIYNFLVSLKEKGNLKDWNQVAFLFKSVKNPKVINLVNFLEARGINVYSPRSNLFFDRKEIKLMIGAIIFLFPQFPNVRKWKSDAYLSEWEYFDNCVTMFANEVREPENQKLLKWARGVAKSHLALSKNTDYGFSGLFYQMLQFPMFKKYIEEYKGNTIYESRASRNLATFSHLLSKFEYLHHISVLTPKNINRSIRNLFNQYLRFLMNGGINEYEDSEEYAPSNSVSFLTIHQSKGLEFPVVIVGSLESSPRKQYSELDEILEKKYYSKPPFEPLEKTKLYDFWRLYYTAFSRAQNLLVLTCQEQSANGNGTKNVPSKHFVSSYNKLFDWKDNAAAILNHEFDLIKDVNIKKQYSFTSHINLFETCAVQYKFFKELDFSPVRQAATMFGTLIHQTIEDIHKAVLRNEESIINSEQIQNWFNFNYYNLTLKDRVYLGEGQKQAALEQINNYVNRNEGKWAKIKEAEVDVSLAKENYILSGTIDLIRGQNNTVELIDFKSEKKPDLNNERDKLNHYRQQLEVYAHLVEERIGQKVSKMHLYYTGQTDGNPYVTFNKNSESINRTIKTFDHIVGRIENKDFKIKERPLKHCANCDMRFYCNAKELEELN